MSLQLASGVSPQKTIKFYYDFVLFQNRRQTILIVSRDQVHLKGSSLIKSKKIKTCKRGHGLLKYLLKKVRFSEYDAYDLCRFSIEGLICLFAT